MTRDRWERVQDLFCRALELPSSERTAFVTTVAGDDEVSGEVLRLLDAHDTQGRFDNVAVQLNDLCAEVSSFAQTGIIDRLRRGLGDRYDVERELARGGMAVVFLARDLKHGRRVALKVLPPAVALGVGPQRFHQEIAIAAQLAHPHILPLHDSGEADGLLYYVMPYVEDESLRDRLRREGPLPLEEALRIAGQVADALNYAHARDVVHRDIKPENILLQAGHAVVTDFGIARAMTAAGSGISEPGVVLGTPAYMSPEQSLSGKDLDGRSDIYSLGLVLYEMLAGEPPFSGATPNTILRKQIALPPPPIDSLRPDVPENVKVALTRALAKAPADRFAEPNDFAGALVKPTAGDAKPVNIHRRSVMMAAGLFAVVAAAIGASAILTRSGPSAHPATALIAVLPPAPVVQDTSLLRLGRDLVVTLSTSMDGVGGIRTVDATAVLAQTRESGPLALDPALQLARLLGASGAVHGSIARVGGSVRIDLGLFTTDGGEAVARSFVVADSLDIPGMTDSLAGSLIRTSWRTRAPPRPTLAAVTTQSIPALRAFLEGERAVLENRWEGAAQAYSAAVNEDPAFWLAYWRYAYASWWYLNAVDQSVIDTVRANRHLLPERDRLVFESWVTDSFTVGFARARDAVERYPDYWAAWMQYGDWLFHAGPVYGHALTEAQAALERVVELNPAFLPGWEHLFQLTIRYDTVTARRALDALIDSGFREMTVREFGFDLTRVYRLDLEWARSGVLNDAVVDSVADDLVRRARGRVGGGSNLPQVQAAISRGVLARNPGTGISSIHERVLAEALAGLGEWESAVAMAARYARRPEADRLAAYRMAVLGAWLEVLPPAVAQRHRVASVRPSDDEEADRRWRAELAWLDGLMAAARGHAEELSGARERVREAGASTVVVVDASLAGLEKGLAGDRRRAAQFLKELNWENPDVLVSGWDVHPYVIAVSRLAAGRWLAELGDTTGAERVMRWFDAVWAMDGYRSARRVLMETVRPERPRS